MARNNNFTHGGSVGKNIGLLLRALCNVFAFFLLFFSLGKKAEWYYIVASAALCFILLGVNLLIPLARRKK